MIPRFATSGSVPASTPMSLLGRVNSSHGELWLARRQADTQRDTPLLPELACCNASLAAVDNNSLSGSYAINSLTRLDLKLTPQDKSELVELR